MTLALGVKVNVDASQLSELGAQGAAAMDKIAASAKAAQASVAQVSAAAGQAPTSTLAGAVRQPANVNARPIPTSSPSETAAVSRLQMQMFGSAAQNTISSLSAGASPFQILVQQGSEVAQAFAMGSASPMQILKSLGSSIAGLLSPTVLAAGALTGLSAALLLAGTSFANEQEEIRRRLSTGIARGSGATLDQINGIADQASGISRSTARGLATDIASTGNISGNLIGNLTGLVPGLGALMGGDLNAAAQRLAQAFSDPTKGAEDLEKALGPLDDKTKALIRSMQASGDIAGAQRALYDAVGASIKEAAQQTGFWANAVIALGNAWDSVGHAIEKPFTGGTLQEQLNDAQQKYIEMEKAFSESRGASPDSPLAGIIGQLDSQAQADLQAQLDKVNELQKKVDEAKAKAAAAKKDAEDAAASQQASGYVRSVLPDVQRQQDLQNQLDALNKAASSPDILNRMGVSAEQTRQAIDALSGALQSFLTSDEKARASEQLTIDTINARTAAEKAAIAAQRERLNLSGQPIAPDEQRRREDAAAAAVLAQTTRDATDRLKAANDNAALSGLSDYQRQLAAIDQKYRDIINNDAGSPDAQAKDRQARTAEIYAAQQSAIGGPLRSANQSLQEQVVALELQQKAFGASAGEAAKLAAAQQLINQYNAAGVPITDQLRAAIEAYAEQAGKVAQASSDLTKKQQEVIASLDGVRDTSRSVLGGLFSDLVHGTSAADALANAAGKIGDQLLSNASNQITQGLFGQNGTAGGGVFGNALASIFGQQVGLSTANITAGLVNINGGLAGNITNALGGALGANGAGATAVGHEALQGIGPAAAVTSQALPPVSTASAGTSAITSVTDPVKAAFLDAIASTESGGRYNIRYGGVGSPGKTFSDFSQHPNVPELTRDGQYSTAAGAYQITKSTYDDYGGGAFDANAQREMAWRIAQDRSGMGAGLEDYLQKNGLDRNLIGRLGPTWRGFADNPSRALSTYNARVGQYEDPRSIAAANTNIAQTGQQGRVQVPDLSKLQTSLNQVGTTSQTAAQGIGTVVSNMGNLPAPLTQVATSSTQVAANAGQASGALGSGGGGLAGAIASLLQSLFSGLGGLGGHADGGKISGAGTGRSDSILTRVSHGEFIVNAAATARHEPLLRAINANNLPAFADGGMPGVAPASAGAWRQNGSGHAVQQPGVVMNLYNQAGVEIEQKSTTDSKGQRQLDVYIGKKTADQIRKPGTDTSRALRTQYGLTSQVTRR